MKKGKAIRSTSTIMSTEASLPQDINKTVAHVNNNVYDISIALLELANEMKEIKEVLAKIAEKMK